MKKERNYLIDALKCLACFCVVMLHMPTRKFGDEVFYIENMLGYCGVPVFFMVSGYFAAKHVESNSADSGRWFFKRAVKMVQYFVFFELIFFVCYRLGGSASLIEESIELSREAIGKLLVFNVPVFSGILWYLLAYAYCLVIYGVASHFKKGYLLICVLSPVLLLLYYILGRYSVIIFNRELPYYWSRNFLIYAIPMFNVGFIMPKLNIKRLTNQNNTVLLIVSMFLLFVECRVFQTRESLKGSNGYIFNTIVAFLIVYYATHDPKIRVSGDNILAVIGREYSLYIYGFHGIAGKICSVLVKFTAKLDKNAGTFAMSFYHISKPICVFLMSLFVAWIYVKMKRKVISLKKVP